MTNILPSTPKYFTDILPSTPKYVTDILPSTKKYSTDSLPSTPQYFTSILPYGHKYFTIQPQIFYHPAPNILHWVQVCAFQTRSSQILRCTDSPKPGLQYIFCNFNKEAQNHQTNRNKLKQTYASDKNGFFVANNST